MKESDCSGLQNDLNDDVDVKRDRLCDSPSLNIQKTKSLRCKQNGYIVRCLCNISKKMSHPNTWC